MQSDQPLSMHTAQHMDAHLTHTHERKPTGERQEGGSTRREGMSTPRKPSAPAVLFKEQHAPHEIKTSGCFFQAILLKLSSSWYFPRYPISRGFFFHKPTHSPLNKDDLHTTCILCSLCISENDIKHGRFQAFTGWLLSDTPSPCRYLTLQAQEPLSSQFLAGSRTWQRTERRLIRAPLRSSLLNTEQQLPHASPFSALLFHLTPETHIPARISV